VAFHEHGQIDLVKDGHDTGVGPAGPQGAAGPIETKVVGQQHADRVAREAPDVFEVDNNLAGDGKAWPDATWMKQQRARVLARINDRLYLGNK